MVLTEAGLDVVDQAMERHVVAEQEQVAGLTEEEQQQLSALLRKLLLHVEGRSRSR